MRSILLVFIAPLLLLTACTKSQPTPPAAIVGADRDAHGCIGSAGYSWCEKTAQCERPWELAQKAGFTLSQPAFVAYCSGPR